MQVNGQFPLIIMAKVVACEMFHIQPLSCLMSTYQLSRMWYTTANQHLKRKKTLSNSHTTVSQEGRQ